MAAKKKTLVPAIAPVGKVVRDTMPTAEVVSLVDAIVSGYGALKAFVEAANAGKISPEDFHTAVYSGRDDATVKKLTASIRATLMRMDGERKLVILPEAKTIAITGKTKDDKRDVKGSSPVQASKVAGKLVSSVQATAADITGAVLDNPAKTAMAEALCTQVESFIAKLSLAESQDFGKRIGAILKKNGI